MSPTTTVVGGTILLVASTAAGIGLAPVVIEPDRDTARPSVTTSPSTAPATTRADASATPSESTTGPAAEPRRPPGQQRPTAPAAPVRFHSDRLGVTVPIRPIEADDGVLLPPGDPQQLGWWRSGAMPGAGRGRVLVTGHTVQTGGGAFDDLSRLRLGDVVAERTRAGRHRDRVELTQHLMIEEFADRAPQLLRSTGPERLVLVTCDGWDGTGYQGSTVVVAEPG